MGRREVEPHVVPGEVIRGCGKMDGPAVNDRRPMDQPWSAGATRQPRATLRRGSDSTSGMDPEPATIPARLPI